MDAEKRYIQVVVPLKLAWNPTYSTDDPGICVGDRVKVRISGHLHDAVVIATDVAPDIDPSRIQAIEGVAKGLERITSGEIELWKFIASYYLCTLGEVYKGAYPSGKIQSETHAAEMTERRNAMAKKREEEARARKLMRIARLQERIAGKEADLEKKHRAEVTERLKRELGELRLKLEAENAVQDARRTALPSETADADISTGHCPPVPDETVDAQTASILAYGSRPVLLHGDMAGRRDIYLELASRTLAQGRSVLFLSPENAQSRDMEADARRFGIAEKKILSCRSADTAAHRRKVAEAIRTGSAYLIFGTRMALFLPFTELGLIIIDEEQDTSYKQDSPAPRYNARDTAVMLATIHHARTVLGSATPSLESLHNACSGRYGHVMSGSSAGSGVSVEVIDTTAERRKRGMVGQISRKLIEAVNLTGVEGGRSMVITTWNDKSSLISDASAVIPDAAVFNMKEARLEDFGEYGLVALVQADTLLGGEDFRADEKALQLFDRFRLRCSHEGRSGRFIIQTANSDHQVFRGFQEMAGTGASAYDLLLPEREMFGFPPFSRIVDVVIRDESPKRLEFMSARLMEAMCASLKPVPGIGAPVQVTGPVVPEAWKEDCGTRRSIRIILRRDGRLASRKSVILDCVSRFEKEMKYTGHVTIDVDPL